MLYIAEELLERPQRENAAAVRMATTHGKATTRVASKCHTWIGTDESSHSSEPGLTYVSSSMIMSSMSRRQPQNSSFCGPRSFST